MINNGFTKYEVMKTSDVEPYFKELNVTEVSEKSKDVIKSILIQTSKGPLLIEGSYYGESLTFKKPEVKTMWRVHGTLGPVPFEQMFESETAGKEYMEKIRGECQGMPVDISLSKVHGS